MRLQRGLCGAPSALDSRAADVEPIRLERPFECASCGALVDELADGWHGMRTEDPDAEGPPELAFLCADCELPG